MDQEFYACPGGQNGCQGWIGWVDESKNQQKPAFKSSFKKSSAKSGAKFSKPNENEVCYNADGEPCCKECGISCITKTSRTEKNMNREFFVCQKNCQVWNGWTDDPNAVKTFFKAPSNTQVVPPKPQAPIQSAKQPAAKQPAVKQPVKTPSKQSSNASKPVIAPKPMLMEERFSDDDIDLNDEY